ncbi:cohesin subunit SA-2-like isoform X2 [Mytilus galloprovincialis]|uniref:cohesin subunit SA-2-like isoform X2 n=1 Tax=Mytilus galloprovincialis TaxID=29158 RepID=UPI003F7C2CD0
MVGRPRKAKVDAEARSMAEPSSEISLPENDDDSDFEEPPVVTKGRKRQKRGDGPAPKRGGGGGRGRGRKKSGGGGGAAVGGGADDDADSGTGSMFDVVKGGRSSLQSLVDDWIESYKNDRDSALLELIQFFIQGSGCKGKITPYMYANQEHAEIIRRMTEEFDEESGDYPLIMSGPIWKRFRSNFCEFVQVLVRQCQYSIIYDQYMMDNIISLLTGLTDSQVRAFRHTSTLAAMKLMTALVDVALNLSINLDNTQRQYEAERQKQQMKRANDRLDMLLTRRQELEENQAEIRNMLTYIFRGVFVHRYRDTQPEIRSICMTEIGVWMKKYPNMFLDDAYLKYVGWTLYDKIGDVRQCCLRALYPLYETEDLSPKLELFTNRFKDRIVEMTLDKEYDVAVQGIRLVISILRYNDTILSDKDCENVYELVYSSNRQVAQAAGEFLNTKLFLRDYEGPKTLKIHKGKKQSLNAPLIRDLVQFFIESELHEHAAYLVDSLWDINDMMKDWDCMTDLLLDEPQKGEEPLDDRQETSLIEIMVCCVKQAATGESPVGRGHNRKLTAKETKNVSEDKTRLTEHFISTLPQLLLKYLMDPEKVANLLLVPQYFELDIYTASRQEKNLEALLRYLHEVVEKHTDTEVLEACSKCYECLCCEEYAIAGKCDVARKTLIDSLVVKFKEAMQDFFAEGEEPDEDEIFALTASLKRIYAFYSCHNLTSWDLWDDIFSIIKNGNENQTIPDEIVSKAMSSASMSVLWYLQKLDENNPSKDEMKALRKRLNDLLKYCHELMYHPKDRVNEEAFITICDLLIVFSKNMANNDMMKPLVYEPDKNLQQQLSNFLTDKVFVDDEDDDVDENVKIEELHKRRNFLACFCKLIVYNIVGIRVAADMFKHYMKFYNDYGDIIKATLSKAREINKVTTAKTLALSLTQLYREQFADGGPIDRSSDSFQSLKELARRFALSFGLDAVKNREAVAAMHKEGILFSLSRPDDHRDHSGPPPYLTFLEILSEFTNKLMKPDRRVVLAYLDKNLPDGGISSTEDWQSLIAYRNSLLQGESEVHPVTLKQASARRYGKRKQMPDVSDHDSNTGDWQDHSAMTPAPGIGGPQLTSTAVKRRRMDEESLGGASEPGSEQDFEGSGSVQQMTQMPWLNAQKREHLEATYQRMKQAANIPPLESEGSEERSIGEFESPPQLLQQQYQQYQQGYYDNSSQNIEDGSSDMSHPGF